MEAQGEGLRGCLGAGRGSRQPVLADELRAVRLEGDAALVDQAETLGVTVV